MPLARSAPSPERSLPPLSGAGRATRERLARLGIRSAFDLVLHLPLRYEDETRIVPIAQAPAGRPLLVEGTVVEAEAGGGPRRQLLCRIADASGELTLRFFHFYPGQQRALSPGRRVRAYGEIRRGLLGAEMVHPRWRIVEEGAPLERTLTPVYPTTAGLAQQRLRRLIAGALERCELEDTLPAALLARLALPVFSEAVRLLHHPPAATSQAALAARSHPAWRRVKFDELLAQQLSLRLQRERRGAAPAPALAPGGRLARALAARLPFALTAAQRRAWREIAEDLARPRPMQRLLQGDVGSGKTVVAALAAAQCVDNGYQVAVMAPTEILAEQHFAKLSAWLAPLGVRPLWLGGGLGRRERRAALPALARGEASVAVGTHALIEEGVEFARLGLAIIDEQHRFGVHQRLALRRKGTGLARGALPHQLMMSATPIPRTLAMSYYADLDVSLIDELPPGRAPVRTRLFSQARRAEVIRRVRDACMGGAQAYWVCPLIEETEPDAARPPLKTVLETHATLAATFPELRLGLLHGRLAPEDKARTMEAFRRGEIQLLVATTVIEVGVDVPAATLMVIEHAERMGLAQLHQLRGRIGRGPGESTCILLYSEPLSETARERLRIIYENDDGFEIARHDLRLRGPGELLGARQSGVALLRFADLGADLELIERAREAAVALLRERPDCVRAHLARWVGMRHEYLKA